MMATDEEMEEAAREHAIWKQTARELRNYDTGACSGGTPAREAAYMAEYLRTVRYAAELSRAESSLGVIDSTLNARYKLARLARNKASDEAGTGKHIPVYTESEQIEARRLRAAMQASAMAIECLEQTVHKCIELSESVHKQPNLYKIDDIYRKVLAIWLLQVTAWEHAGPKAGEGRNPPPCPLKIVQGMAWLG